MHWYPKHDGQNNRNKASNNIYKQSFSDTKKAPSDFS